MGPIIGMGEDYCVIRNDGTSDDDPDDTVVACEWDRVELRDVQPDPAYITAETNGNCSETAPLPKPNKSTVPTTGYLWELFDPDTAELDAYLITADADPCTSMVAYMPFATAEDSAAGRRERREMFNVAERIAADPSTVPTMRGVIDVREMARDDSEKPTLARLYTLLIAPVNDGFDAAEPFQPFCRFRMVKMLRQFADMHFDEDDLNEHPYVTAGITDGPSGKDAHFDSGASLIDLLM